LAVAVIIAMKRVARAQAEVKAKKTKKTVKAPQVIPDLSTGFYLVPGSSFAGETPVPRKECVGEGLRVVWRLEVIS